MATLTEILELNLPRMETALREYESVDSSGGIALADPRDGKVIGSHYSLSHYIGALMLSGETEKRTHAKKVLQYVAATQDRFVKYPDYHYDFNNFIWSLLLTLNRSGQLKLDDEERASFEKLLLESGDSRHMTLNWLPMRTWSNLERWRITGQEKYRKTADRLLDMVRHAQDKDGLFGDRVRIGRSANPQYHTYTAAVLTLGKSLGVWDYSQEELDLALQWVTGIVLPDGDFNFFGRGTNQIFAWGPWFYLLAVNGINPGISGDFFSKHLPGCLERNGLMLEYSGDDETRFWRSYHHASVYQAHLYFWLTLARRFASKEPQTTLSPVSGNQSGAYIFRGMRDMLPERGPMVAAFWTGDLGVCFKSPLGNIADNPVGAREHASLFGVLANYCGLIKVGRKNGFDYRCGAVFPREITMENTSPVKLSLRFHGLPRPGVFFDWKRHGIDIRKRYREYYYFQLPVFHRLGLNEDAVNRRFEVSAQDKAFGLHFVATIPGVYGDMDVYSTQALPRLLDGIVLQIKDKEI